MGPGYGAERGRPLPGPGERGQEHREVRQIPGELHSGSRPRRVELQKRLKTGFCCFQRKIKVHINLQLCNPFSLSLMIS